MKPRIIAVINQKGGSGKTTTTVNLAAELQAQGKRVLVVDLDAQASASRWLGAQAKLPGISAVLDGEKTMNDIIETTSAGIGLAPSSRWMLSAEITLRKSKVILKDALSPIKSRFDFILMDCPPAMGNVLLSALVASTEVLIAVEASHLAVQGVADIFETLRMVRATPWGSSRVRIKLCGLLVCRVDRTRVAREVEADLRAAFKNKVFSVVIPEDVKVRESWAYSKTLREHAGRCRAALAYKALALQLTSPNKGT